MESILFLINWDIIIIRSKRFSSRVSKHQSHDTCLETGHSKINNQNSNSEASSPTTGVGISLCHNIRNKKFAYWITGCTKNFFDKKKKYRYLNGHARIKSVIRSLTVSRYSLFGHNSDWAYEYEALALQPIEKHIQVIRWMRKKG